MSPKIVDKEEKKRAIALAAIQVFGEKGFDRARMDDIAKTAGVGKGTLYEYFKDKEEVLEHSFQTMMSDVWGDIGFESDPEASIFDALHDVTFGVAKLLEDMGSLYRFFLEYMLHLSRSEKPADFLAQVLEEFRSVAIGLLEQGKVTGEIRADLDSANVAAAYAAWFDGIIFHWVAAPEMVDLQATTKAFWDMIAFGMFTKPKEVGSKP